MQDLFTQPTETLDPLYLDIDGYDLVTNIKDNIRASVNFYSQKNLYERQQKNLDYYLGNQEEFKPSSKSPAYKENIIYEAMLRQKPIALSRLPDLTVKPGDNSPETQKTTEQLSGIFNKDTKKRENRKLLGLAFKQEPIYFYSVIKAIWDPEKGKFGDYRFVSVHPDNIVWDHTCSTNNADDMRFVSEKTQMTLKEMIMMFPSKEDEIKEEFGWTQTRGDDQAKLASQVNLWENWFHWYKKAEGGQYQRVDGVAWMYKNLLLKKIKNPYFDYQGQNRLFKKEIDEKQALSEDEIFDLIDIQKGEYVETDKVYNNYFQVPRKPYFFMVYENMGEHPVSETSRIEQSLDFQDFVNRDGSIIQDMNLRSRGKNIFDTNAIDLPTLEKVDMYDYDKAIGINVPRGSSTNNAHSLIQQQPATMQQYKSMNENRMKAFEMLGLSAENRGLSDPDSTLGQSQMAREGDFSLIDDIVEDTINSCAKWQAQWSMQFIKLFYTKPHMRHILGKDGDTLHMRLTQDMVDDSMEVVVSASGVDKIQRKRQAIENAKLGFTEALTYYEDTEQSRPKERAKRAMLAQSAPQVYMQTYLMEEEQQQQGPVPGQPQQPAQPPQQAPPGVPMQ